MNHEIYNSQKTSSNIRKPENIEYNNNSFNLQILYIKCIIK